MDWSKVGTTFFIMMSLTTTVGFVYDGDPYELIASVVFNLIATILKLGSKKTLSAELLATSLAADLHLIPALIFYELGTRSTLVEAFAWGALVANIFSVIIVIIETILEAREETWW
ncbi:hypothetical protein Dester_0570 [Desulfurobacterium thermolithotrophum DSM 11699]|uniref:Integral membrane protein n=1 Tax=Desulfurobacterium thermolithotrophum (strain DSM 11699 / BSA) TaxID=868864 RepID=F0S2Z9_DESTD|nr:DUF6394 family protein [Desulfurobacterium thermolithotrophum]ADY73221.1 hypothetical protein Dester_0570 [Desulfurobacterium thermolithotrophum DSM 11699]